ncbi:Dioxygenase swnH1 [Cladobotryum mycophilum]|uniref:Dioxygenase swnH1 n=1 Tax=Cladobotryum mycophilum TaxID=491253 RepID=A0ABR0SJX0_9HYPO
MTYTAYLAGTTHPTQTGTTYPTEAGTQIVTVSALDPATDAALLESILQRDGAVIVRSLVPQSLCQQIKEDLKPLFDSDTPDAAGFFPKSTKRAHGILARSDASAELVLNPLFQGVAERMLISKYTYWEGQEQKTVAAKPQITSIVGFRVEPGGSQQALHRDDADYHTRNCDMPVMLACVTALSRTTRANGATVVIPKSHLWGPDRCPLDKEAISAELEVGDAAIFVGNVYHAGGSNTTTDEARETIGVFMCKGTLRQEENQYLELPPNVAMARGFSPQLLRLLGYGICPPALGLYKYKDPMEEIFHVLDEETVRR